MSHPDDRSGFLPGREPVKFNGAERAAMTEAQELLDQCNAKREPTLVRALRGMAAAYPEDIFKPVTDAEREQHASLVTRASAAMGRHCAPLFLDAASEIERLSVSLSEGSSLWRPMSETPATTGSYLVWIGPRNSHFGEIHGRVQIERYTADDGAPKNYFGDVGWKTYSRELAVQTHWMPLPEAPK